MAGRRRQDDWGSSNSSFIPGEYRGVDKAGKDNYRQDLLYQQQVKQVQKDQERLEKQIEARISQQQAQTFKDYEERKKIEEKLQKRNLADMYAYQISQGRNARISPLALQERERSSLVEGWIRQGAEEQEQRNAERDMVEYRLKQQRRDINAQILRQQIADKEQANRLEQQAERMYGGEVQRNAQAHRMMEEQVALGRKLQQADYFQQLNSQIGSRGVNRMQSGSQERQPSSIRNIAATMMTSGSSAPKPGNKENTLEDNISAFYGSDAGDYRPAQSPYAEVDYFSKPVANPPTRPSYDSVHNPISNPVGGQMPRYDGRPMYRSRGLYS